jgi:hypothetical protein
MRRALSSWALPKGVKAAVFGTYGGKPAQLGVLEKILREKGAEVVDRFSCMGRDWFFLGLIGRGRPSEEDLKAAREFAEKGDPLNSSPRLRSHGAKEILLRLGLSQEGLRSSRPKWP